MKRKTNIFFLSSLIVGLASVLGFQQVARAGITSGADIYCVMRIGGNPHEQSWQAAYTNIKRQRPGLFKTSPKQAATIIVEQVVADPGKYEECVGFLGDLYQAKDASKKDIESRSADPRILNNIPSEGKYDDRYSY